MEWIREYCGLDWKVYMELLLLHSDGSGVLACIKTAGDGHHGNWLDLRAEELCKYEYMMGNASIITSIPRRQAIIIGILMQCKEVKRRAVIRIDLPQES